MAAQGPHRKAGVPWPPPRNPGVISLQDYCTGGPGTAKGTAKGGHLHRSVAFPPGARLVPGGPWGPDRLGGGLGVAGTRGRGRAAWGSLGAPWRPRRTPPGAAETGVPGSPVQLGPRGRREEKRGRGISSLRDSLIPLRYLQPRNSAAGAGGGAAPASRSPDLHPGAGSPRLHDPARPPLGREGGSPDGASDPAPPPGPRGLSPDPGFGR